MGRFAFVTWDGGGNVSVALSIGQALLEAGHSVTLLGPPSLREDIEASGARFRECGIAPPIDPALRPSYLAEIVGSTSLGSNLESAILELKPDVLVIDCNLSWA